MIIEFIIFVGLFILTFLLLSKYKIKLIDIVVENLAILPISHDTRLDSLLEIAGRYYVEKNFLSAEKAYLKVLKVDHKNSLAYSRLGFIYSHFGQIEDAIECFQIVADTYPNAASYYNLAMMLFKNHKFKRAAYALEKSIDLEVTPARLIALARVYRVMGQYELQIKILQRALDMKPEEVSIMLLLAEAYIHEGEEKKARDLFKHIIKIEPNNLRAKQALEPNRILKKLH